ncbi:MAG: metalloregulator ArsR/SmtB family transcription factor [Candidatus Ozemobacteraceae bacterium]
MDPLPIFKALSDASRLAVIKALLTAPQCVEELAQRLDLSAPTVSFHLRKLETASLVTKERQQYYVVYRPNDAMFDVTLLQLLGNAETHRDRQEQRLEASRRKVLSSYLPHGRLIRLPSQSRKRRIILEHLAVRFIPEKSYPEAEVNQILLKVHEDYCLLRRLLVDEGLLERSRGVYWRGASPDTSQSHLLTGPRLADEPATPDSPLSLTKGSKTMDTRKELKRKYLDNPPSIGVFQIKNIKNGKLFLAGSMNLQGAFNKHRFQLEMGSHRHRDLQEDWKRFGPESFVFEILDTLKPGSSGIQPSKDDLARAEKQWLEKIRPFGDRGYNNE